MKPQKTNAMRELDAAGIEYKPLYYEFDEDNLAGVHVAAQIGIECERVFKTLAANGDKNGVVVFCIPSDAEIDLKKAAASTGNKRVELLHVKDLPAYTGYIRGGVSPLGMKKKYPVFFDEAAELFDRITISAGVRGCQLYLSREALIAHLGAKTVDIV